MPNCSRKTITDPPSGRCSGSTCSGRISRPESFAHWRIDGRAAEHRDRSVRAPRWRRHHSHRRSSAFAAPSHREQQIRAGDDADFSLVGMHARLLAPSNCPRSFAQISLCDAQSVVPAKNIFPGSRVPGSCPRATAADRLRDLHALHRTQAPCNKTA
jgi:hypothetical protein